MGGLSPKAPLPPLLTWALEQCEHARPRLGLLATASGDAEELLNRFYEQVEALPCRPSHLPVFGRTPDPARWLDAQDLVLVAGGNTLSMLGSWRAWQLDRLLREGYERGLVLLGWSAGAICWFEQGLSDSWAGELRSVDGLALLPGSCCPHIDSEPERRPAYHRAVASGAMAEGVAIEDGAAVDYVAGEMRAVVAFRPGARAFRVERAGAGVRETELDLPRIELDEATA